MWLEKRKDDQKQAVLDGPVELATMHSNGHVDKGSEHSRKSQGGGGETLDVGGGSLAPKEHNEKTQRSPDLSPPISDSCQLCAISFQLSRLVLGGSFPLKPVGHTWDRGARMMRKQPWKGRDNRENDRLDVVFAHDGGTLQPEPK